MFFKSCISSVHYVNLYLHLLSYCMQNYVMQAKFQPSPDSQNHPQIMEWVWKSCMVSHGQGHRRQVGAFLDSLAASVQICWGGLP